MAVIDDEPQDKLSRTLYVNQNHLDANYLKYLDEGVPRNYVPILA